MAAPKPITEEEYRRWYTPKQALEIVGKAMAGDWNAAYPAILQRLAGGKILAHAEDIDWKQVSKTGALPKYSAVGKDILDQWNKSNHQSYLPFWSSGNATVELRTGHSLSDAPLTINLYGIRFDPDGINKLAGIATPLAASSAALAVTSPEPEQKGPRVSDPLLKEWFALYSKAYPDAEDTEDRAVESARGMFQGKSVSRDRVRALRGARKRGPKPKTAE